MSAEGRLFLVIRRLNVGLSAKQEAFCKAIVSGKNQYEAYKESYNVKPGTLRHTIDQSAVRLMKNPAMTQRIEDLRAPAIKAVGLTLESHLIRLAYLSKLAEENGDLGPAITAETNRGKAAGLYTQKIEMTVDTDRASRLERARERIKRGE
jgi:hypothetical protein